MTTYEQQGATEPLPSALTVANVVYALHTLAIIVGLAGAATIVGSFVGSVPSIIAVILNYAKRGDARGTWVESHYRWQIRTFWFALLWIGVTLLVSAPLVLIVIGVFLGIAGFIVVGLWVAYRVARGWLALRARQPMPGPATRAAKAGP